MKRPYLLFVAGTLVAATASACSTSTPTIALGLNPGGCDAPVINVPTGKIKLVVTNRGDGGEFEIIDGDDVLVKENVDLDETINVPVNLKTGTYVVECRTDETTALLVAGTPTGAKGEPGAAAEFPAAPTGFGPKDGNSYDTHNLVANSAIYSPDVVDPSMVNAWGLANRPAGLGGHIWVAASNSGQSIEYVGDIGGVPLYQDELRSISIPGAPGPKGSPPAARALGTPTGVVFNGAPDKFVITQGSVTGPAKFIFAGTEGTISAWTERKNADGSADRASYASLMADRGEKGSAYFGLAVAPSGDKLLVADFGTDPAIRTYDDQFQEVPTVGFVNPFGKKYLPWNVTTVGNRVLVSYVALGPEGGEELQAPGAGRIVEFDGNGALVKTWKDKKALNAPWGIEVAPAEFGKLAGSLLVANFGDGTIAAFDSEGTFVDYVRGADGKPVVIDGIWGLLRGNGASLGAADAVYFSAGPRGEQDGVFGRLTASSTT